MVVVTIMLHCCIFHQQVGQGVSGAGIMCVFLLPTGMILCIQRRLLCCSIYCCTCNVYWFACVPGFVGSMWD